MKLNVDSSKKLRPDALSATALPSGVVARLTILESSKDSLFVISA